MAFLLKYVFMHIELLKKEDITRLSSIKSLINLCFKDETDFVDYYFDHVLPRADAYIMFDDNNNPISMIVMNPYLFNICGNIKTIHYIEYVTTAPEFRNKGYMRDLMNKTLEYLKSLNEPFCILMPNDQKLENTYSHFGFEIICKYNNDKFSHEDYDIFPVRTDEFNTLMQNEKKLQEKDTKEYLQELVKKPIMAKILNKSNIDINFLKSEKIYICQEV